MHGDRTIAVSADDFPVGIEDFDKPVTLGKVYVDKTEELEKLIRSGADVTLLPIPQLPFSSSNAGTEVRPQRNAVRQRMAIFEDENGKPANLAEFMQISRRRFENRI